MELVFIVILLMIALVAMFVYIYCYEKIFNDRQVNNIHELLVLFKVFMADTLKSVPKVIMEFIECLKEWLSRLLKKIRDKIESKNLELKDEQRNKYQIILYNYFKRDYKKFAACMRDCLQSDPARYSVVSPKRIQDVFVSDSMERIYGNLYSDGSYDSIVFRFEVKRVPTNINLATIISGTGAYVPVAVVQSDLQKELPKYIDDYKYSGISLYEIENNNIIIEVYNIYPNFS